MPRRRRRPEVREFELDSDPFVRAYRLAPEDLAAEGTFDSSGQDVWEGDDVEYALEREEWERLRQNHRMYVL